MNELKPEDVMRALECCANDQACSSCPLVDDYSPCATTMAKNALSLLREKDALLAEWDAKCNDYETELLGKTMDIEKFKACCDEKDAEIERLTVYNASLRCDNKTIAIHHENCVEEAKKTARAEAITEFVDRLKGKTYFPKPYGMARVVDEYEIDQIAKEMKEGKGDA